ncbi:hypothetical protein DFJ73DRAFT_782269 [Zopfochytrium polystomum]|nr:hypothetical protein DFJ73DRAFT_782269 [Zopfochytrium polystomum]
MSGRGKTQSGPALPAPTASSSSSRRISDFFAPSSFSALSPDPPVTTNDPAPPPSITDPPFTPVGDRKRNKRKVLSPANPGLQPFPAIPAPRSSPPPPPLSPPSVTPTFPPPIPLPPTFSGSDRLSSALHSHPPYLQKAFLVPKPGIFDPILRILPSAHYSIPKSHNELLDDVKTSINPLLRELQSIIADQDDLIRRLFSLLPSAQQSRTDRSTSTRKTATSDKSTSTVPVPLTDGSTSPPPAPLSVDATTITDLPIVTAAPSRGPTHPFSSSIFPDIS